MKYKSISLHISSSCNLACNYCYIAEQGAMRNEMMSFDTAISAIQEYLSPDGTISFFGGEPLFNSALVIDVVSWCKENMPDVKFHITTNGTLITEGVALFLSMYHFSVIVSLDGDKDIHNSTRKTKDGKGSYFKVMEGLYYLKKYNVPVTIRATFTPKNTNLLERTKHLHLLLDNKLCNACSIEPINETESVCTTGIGFTLQDVDNLAKEYHQVVDFLIERTKQGKSVSFHQIMYMVHRIKSGKYWFSECGAGLGCISVTPDKKVYSCHKLGKTGIGELYNLSEDKLKEWKHNHITNNEICQNCDVFMICGGPCRYQSLQFDGTQTTPDPVACAFRRLWIESAKQYIKGIKDGDKRQNTKSPSWCCKDNTTQP